MSLTGDSRAFDVIGGASGSCRREGGLALRLCYRPHAKYSAAWINETEHGAHTLLCTPYRADEAVFQNRTHRDVRLPTRWACTRGANDEVDAVSVCPRRGEVCTYSRYGVEMRRTGVGILGYGSNDLRARINAYPGYAPQKQTRARPLVPLLNSYICRALRAS